MHGQDKWLAASGKRQPMHSIFGNLKTRFTDNDGLSSRGAITERRWRYCSNFDRSAHVETERSWAAIHGEKNQGSMADVASIRKQIDQLSESYRLLGTQIQEANWLTDLPQN